MESSIPPATSFRHSQICSAEGAPHTTIRLRKLSCQALLGDDPWRRARDRQNIFQPVFLSATLSLRKPFQSAADADVINDSTVNYSTLTKAIQKVVASRQPESETDWSVNDFLDSIFLYLTGYLPNSNGLNNADLAKSRILGDFASVDQNTLLKRDDLKEFVLEAFLPKGSLLSGGITLTKSVYYSASDNEGVKTIQQSYCSILKIHDMQIPTLIGINSNERTARQLIVASVEIDPYIPENRDSYNDLHKIVFEVCSPRNVEVRHANKTADYRRILLRDPRVSGNACC